MRKHLLEAFLTLVERRHVSLVAKLRRLASIDAIVAPCITGLGRQGNPPAQATCPLRRAPSRLMSIVLPMSIG
jgi:hypothetical protein